MQCHHIAVVSVLLSPKPSGTEPPTCKGPEACDAVRPQGQDAEDQTGVPSNGQKYETSEVEAPAKKELG